MGKVVHLRSSPLGKGGTHSRRCSIFSHLPLGEGLRLGLIGVLNPVNTFVLTGFGLSASGLFLGGFWLEGLVAIHINFAFRTYREGPADLLFRMVTDQLVRVSTVLTKKTCGNQGFGKGASSQLLDAQFHESFQWPVISGEWSGKCLGD